MKKDCFLFTAVAVIGIVLSGLTLNSCKKLLDDDLKDMDNENNLYRYQSQSNDFDYAEAPGHFNTAIKLALGTEEAVKGTNESKVIEACDRCYEELKEKLNGKKGKVWITKIRYPDGKQKMIKIYDF